MSCGVGGHCSCLSEISVCILLLVASAAFSRASDSCILWVAALIQSAINPSYAEILYFDTFKVLF